jgi:hypothetical protein
MEHYIVTRANGTTYSLSDKGINIASAEQKKVVMGQDIVTMTVESVGYIDFVIGDSIVVFGEKYTLNALGQPERIAENHFRYSLTWEGVKYELTKVIYRNADALGFNPSGEFSLTGKVENFLQVLKYNLDRTFGVDEWSIGDLPETEAKTLSFTNENCLNVLNTICTEFDTEYEIAVVNGVNVIHIRKAGVSTLLSVEYGKGKGLYSLSRKNVDSKNIITRLFAEGSDKNIKAGYRDNALRLRLSVNSESYIDSSNISQYGIIEGAKTFDDVYPHRTGTISGLGADIFTFVDASMSFDLNERDAEGNTKWLMSGQAAKIHFNTGNLGGYEFEVISYDHATKTFKIKQYTDERGLKIPNPDSAAFQLAAGDTYVLLDILMPDSYIAEAEAELLSKAQEYLAQNSQPRVEYDLSVDPFYLKSTFGDDGSVPNIFSVGDYINVKDDKIGVDKSVRINEFKRKLDKPYEYALTLSDVSSPTRIERLIAATVEAGKAVKINKLTDPARARRNWRDAEEVAGMVDTLRAEVALIGSPEGQFQTDIYFIPNYNGNANVFKTTLGLLVHSAYPAENPGTWDMAAYEGTLEATKAYYIYAKCSRSSQAGVVIASLTKIGVEDDTNYYHFPIGVLSSVSDNARSFTSTYGYTLISGNNITTGIIQNLESGLEINLQTGEIKGNFKFTSGVSIETAVNTATTNAATAQSTANAAQTTANNAATAASNAQASANTANSAIANITSDNVLSAAEKPSQRKEFDIIWNEKQSINSQAAAFGITTQNNAYNTAFQNLGTYLNGGLAWDSELYPLWIDDANLSVDTAISGTTYRSKWSGFYVARTALLNAISAKAKTLADAAQSTADNIQVGGRNLLKKSMTTPILVSGGKSGWGGTIAQRYTAFSFNGMILKKSQQYTISFLAWTSNGNYPLNIDLYPDTLPQITNLVTSTPTKFTWTTQSESSDMASCALRFFVDSIDVTSMIYITDIKIEEGNRATDWTPAPEDVDAAIALAKAAADEANYLKTALQGSTDVNGGLLATNVLLMKDSGGAIRGGMSGLANDNIGMWTGGTYAEAIAALAKIIMRKDGSGQLAGGKILFDALGSLLVGAFNIEGGSIIGYADNKDKVKFHTGAIASLTDLLGNAWTQAASTYFINDTDLESVPENTLLYDYYHYFTQWGELTVPANTSVKFNPAVINVSIDPEGHYSDVNVSQWYLVYKNTFLIGTYPASSTNVIVLEAGGTYDIIFKLEVTSKFENNTSEVREFSINAATTSPGFITYSSVIEKTEIGKDGFYSYWSNALYLYFSATNGFKLKGATDIPGVLASGSIASGGGHTNKWGAKVGAASATYTATGIYDVPHTVGSSGYTVSVQPTVDGNHAFVISKSSTSFRVQIRNNSGTAVSGAFDYTIVGAN